MDKKMKNKYIIISLLISALVIPVAFVRAEDEDTSDTGKKFIPIDKIEMLKNRASTTEQIKAKVQERVQEAKEKAQERVQQGLEKAGEMMKKKSELITMRYENAIERLEKAQEKILEAITKLEARGLDMTTAKANLEAAKVKVEAARAELSAIRVDLDDTEIGTSTIKTVISTIKAQNEAFKNVLKTAHASLIDVLNSLRSDVKKYQEDKKNSTSTATTTQE
ncbi:MAG: hypothetical protein WAV11_01450 [Minisyncoccia bacterium]